MPAEYFEARERALLGERYDTLYAAPQETAARGVTVSALRTTPEGFAARADFPLRPSPFCKAAFVVEQPDFKPGRHPYHHAGVFYSQEPSASSAAPLLGVRPGMRVLDLCAAPGGKSSQLAAALQGQGLLVSNEYVAARAEILKSNLERMGVSNAVVLNETPARIAAALPEFFDRVLVDAPCSGEGMFRKEPAALAQHCEALVKQCAELGADILDSAAAALAPGGELVYSTCTFAPEENEGVISGFLQDHPEFSVAEADAPWFSPGRPDWIENPAPGLERTFRLWPHKLKGEGHFAAILEKAGDAPGAAQPTEASVKEPKELAEFRKAAGAALPEGTLIAFGRGLYLAPEGLPALRGLKVLRPGLELGQVLKNRFEPAHAWAMWLQETASVADFPADSPEIAAYLTGGTIAAPQTGWTLLTVDGLSLGWVKGSGGVLKNHLPKGLRRMVK